MSIKKNNFYCLTTDKLLLETDYIYDFNSESSPYPYSFLNSLNNAITIKNITVEVEDIIDKKSIIYNTDNEGGTTTNSDGVVVQNHWQTLVIINKKNDANSTKVLNNFKDIYATGDFYTKLSDKEDFGSGNNDNYGIQGPNSKYEFSLDKGPGVYEIDFYLFLHINKKNHSDSTIVVPNHPELAIAKVTKTIELFQEVKAELSMKCSDVSTITDVKDGLVTTSSSINIKDNSYICTYKGIGFNVVQNSNASKVTLTVANQLGFDSAIQSDWELYSICESQSFKPITTQYLLTSKNVNYIDLHTFKQQCSIIVGKKIVGKSSEKTGPNEKFIYTRIEARTNGMGYNGKEAFYLPSLKLQTKEDTTKIQLTDITRLTVSLSSDLIKPGSRYHYYPAPVDGTTDNLSFEEAQLILKKYVTFTLTITSVTKAYILKSYTFISDQPQVVELPEGKWDISVKANYPLSGGYYDESNNLIFSNSDSCLGDFDSIPSITIEAKANTLTTDLKFQGLHKSELFKDINIIYHNYYPYGAYYEGFTILDSIQSPEFYGTKELSLLNYTNTLTSPLVKKNLFSKNADKYFWDEVFSSPIGVYQNTAIKNNEIAQSQICYVNGSFGGNSTPEFNQISIYISDNHVVPTVGDFIVFQLLPLQTTLKPSTGTDGVNSIEVVKNTLSYIFQITNSENYDSKIPQRFTLTLDKSIELKKDSYYSIILLNRNNSALNENLYSNLWNQYEIHRSQLLGDVPADNSVKQKKNNYINYKSNSYSGIKSQIQNLLPETDVIKSPFIILNLEEQIKDAISTIQGDEIKLELPLLTLQSKILATDGFTSSILENPIFVNDLSKVTIDSTSLGSYSPLVLETQLGIPSAKKTYGYVLHDLNLILISDPEVVMALGYNSNRNYTLLEPEVISVNDVNITSINPIKISNITYDTLTKVTTVTTASTHPYSTGDKVHITDVLGITQLDVSMDNLVIVTGIVNQTMFTITDIEQNPIVVTNAYIKDSGITYSNKPKYQYFLTYLVNDKNCTTLPFNTLIPFNFKNDQVTFYLPDNALDLDFETKVIVGEYAIYGQGVDKTTDIQNVKFVNYTVSPIHNSLTSDKIGQTITVSLVDYNSSNDSYKITNFDSKAAGYTDVNGNPTYPNFFEPNALFRLESLPADKSYFTGMPHILLGNLSYKESVVQFGLTFNLKIPADKWNKSVNPTIEEGNYLHNKKMISEIAFHINDSTGNIDSIPVVYSKIAPPIVKDNLTDLSVQISLEF